MLIDKVITVKSSTHELNEEEFEPDQKESNYHWPDVEDPFIRLDSDIEASEDSHEHLEVEELIASKETQSTDKDSYGEKYADRNDVEADLVFMFSSLIQRMLSQLSDDVHS